MANHPISRAGFLRRASASALAFHIVPRTVLGQGHTPPSDKLHIAGIGIGGQGGGLMRDPAIASQNIVALCDVDWKYADRHARSHARAHRHCRHAHGQVRIRREADGALQRQLAPDEGVDRGRRHRHGEGSAWLERSAGKFLEAGHVSSHGRYGRPRKSGLESVAGRGADGSISAPAH